jgi:CheY-like chemotaxis protein
MPGTAAGRAAMHDAPRDPAGDDPARGLFETAACGLLLCDADGVIEHANERFARWLGYDAPSVLRWQLAWLLSPASALFFESQLRPLIAQQGYLDPALLRFRAVDDSDVPLLVSVCARERGGRVTLEVAAMMVRGREAYEAALQRSKVEAESARESADARARALRESEARARSLFAAGPLATFVLLRSARGAYALVDLNDAGDRLSGGRRGELLGLDARALFGPEIGEEIEACAARMHPIERVVPHCAALAPSRRPLRLTFGAAPPDMVIVYAHEASPPRVAPSAWPPEDPARPSAAPPEDRRSVRPSRGRTLLLVEDEALLRAATRRFLERDGYNVLEAEHGGVALALYREHRDTITGVVSDVQMPVLGGFELAEAIARESPAMPVLLVSGFSAPPIERLGSACDFLKKPFSPSALHDVLERLIPPD